MSNKRYRVGIDVGLYSVGLSALEIDENTENPLDANPVAILNIQSVIHDGAIDPSAEKSADSRKKISGEARRARNLKKARRKRKKLLAKLLADNGFPVQEAESLLTSSASSNPYLPWDARYELLHNRITSESKQKLLLTLAIIHFSNHRGWRNPYSSFSSLSEQSDALSPFFDEFLNRARSYLEDCGESLNESENTRLTTADIVHKLNSLPEKPSLRAAHESADKPYWESHLDTRIGKLHQSDNYYELKEILIKQNLPEDLQLEILKAVFSQINPRDTKAANALVAKDDLQPQFKRSLRASLAFQKYRIITTIMNLRILENGKERQLNDDEIANLYQFLTHENTANDPELTWETVAEVLDISRDKLKGVGGTTADGSPISTKVPPVLNTLVDVNEVFKKKGKVLAPVKAWWSEASDEGREVFIDFVSNSGNYEETAVMLDDEGQQAKSSLDELIENLDEDAIQALEGFNLQSHRAAYSISTLNKLNDEMLGNFVDLDAALRNVFNKEPGWRPSANPLGTPVGNPAADRTIRIVSRWLKACSQKWGKPEIVCLESAREGFRSEKVIRAEKLASEKRHKANEEVRKSVSKQMDGAAEASFADIRRQKSLQRQNSQCLYCGTPITFTTAEMDHIVPRKGVGSTNTQDNLVATCHACNASKGNKLFSVWASKERLQETIERVDHWTRDGSFPNDKAFNKFKNSVKKRLKQTEEDEPIDARSIASVGWMAQELADQIRGFLDDGTSKQKVFTFRGEITYEARLASGLEKKLPWLGGEKQKTRFDRRHHAVDASVIALMRPAIAKTLAERISLRKQEDILQAKTKEWKKHFGREAGDQKSFKRWQEHMELLRDLISKRMQEDTIPVINPLRLSLKLGRAHEDKIRPLSHKALGEELSSAAIDKVSDVRVWEELVSRPDYSMEDGLPFDSERTIRIGKRIIKATNQLSFMSDQDHIEKEMDAANIPVRGGYAVAGNAIHHLRLYAIPKRNRKGLITKWAYQGLRVFQVDLLRHRQEDLFEVPLNVASYSIRYAEKGLKKALWDNEAKYLGWVVVNDEIVIPDDALMLPLSPFNPENKKDLSTFMRVFPETRKFKIAGFPTNSRIKIRPLEMAIENFEPERVKEVHHLENKEVSVIQKVIKEGVSPSTNLLLSGNPTIIRRTTLGYPRWRSDNHMPCSWKIGASDNERIQRM